MTAIHMPELPLTGGCQCASVRYAITAQPFVFYLCHCTECQRHTSSAFGQSLRVDQKHVSITGALKSFRRVSEAGSVREGWFCPECGVRIVHGKEGSTMVKVKAGTLDDTSWLIPAGHIWTRSRQPFMAFRDDDLIYEGQPEDGYAALGRRWRGMLAQK